MFAVIGRFVDRYRLWVLAAWIAAAVAITGLAPNLNDVTSNEEGDFLPPNAASVLGQHHIEQNFPEIAQGPTAVLVFDAGAGRQITDPENIAFIGVISEWLTGPDKPPHVASILSPTLNPEAAGRLIAADGQVAMMPLMLTATDEAEQVALLDVIGEHLEAAPPELAVYRTGEAAIEREFGETLSKSVDRTIFVTLALVAVTLLVIYRSPVSPLLPLFVVTIAFMVARGIVAWLAESIFKVSDVATMMLIVVMYGAGTDYCLFLISRFREEMADNLDPHTSVQHTIRHVGESISSSAGTVITGFMAMSFAQLGLFNTTGPTLAVGVIVSLLAGLTLTPALLGLFGQRTFWPRRAQHRVSGTLYRRTSQLVSSRPLLTIVVIVTVMAPLAYHGSRLNITYDRLVDMPDDAESIEGFRVLETHMGAGEMQPMKALAVFGDGDLLIQVQDLTRKIEAVEGVALVRSASQPLGRAIPGAEDSLQYVELVESYLNRETNAAQFEIVLKDTPYSQSALDTADRVKRVLENNSVESALVGSTAESTDVRHYLGIDQQLTLVLVLGGIFVILVIMLHSIIAPLYLIGTILLSYRTTLGITRIASETLWGTDELTWWVPFFMFVFLVALGIDYSIFLFGRMKEEVRQHGTHEGIHRAVETTGAIITSAGIIVAGTFSALMTGSILGLAQIGFAVASGILIDTFIVRTVLDPALATLFGRWTWWPSGIAQSDSSVD